MQTFMETAANPQFRHNLLHWHMFQYHVLGNHSLPNPGFLPYYSQSFFQTIRTVHEQTPLDVKTITISQWARVLTEDGLTMELVPNMDTRQYIPCKSELLSPNNDWQLSWRLCSLRGLSSEMMSFNFKLLHHLLPVRSRLHQITPATPPNCTLCPCACPETIEHALIFCPYNAGTGMALVSVFKNELASLTTEQLLVYNFPDLSETLKFSLVFLTADLLF